MFSETKREPFPNKVWLSSPTMHGEELRFIKEAYDTNWMSSIGENIDNVECVAAKGVGRKCAVALSSCTAALHLCLRLAGEKLYGTPMPGRGALEGKRVFCSDMTFAATVNPVLYEGGVPVMIDTDMATWNMDPQALSRAFEKYPDVRVVVYAELYGFPGRVTEIRRICREHGAILIEDAAEALGSLYENQPCGSFGDYAVISYNGNKIITGSSGGCFLTDSDADADKVRKWATQSREQAVWYQHEEIGYNYRMSNVIAGVVRGQYPYLQEHIERKKSIFEGYLQAFEGLPVKMMPFDSEKCCPNYWLSALTIDPDALCRQNWGKDIVSYLAEGRKSCPAELKEVLDGIRAESRPIWKPMHLQPVYQKFDFVTASEDFDRTALVETSGFDESVGADIFYRGLCLPSDIKMTKDEQQRIIQVIRDCFA